MFNPHQVTKDFEESVANYTGSKYAIAVDNCSNAIFLCLKYLKIEGKEVTIPSHTYMSVPCAVIHAGGKVKFKESPKKLKGAYRLAPFPVWDSALRFTKGMYRKDQLMCVSFTGPKKILKLGKGGAILTDDIRAYEWLKIARYSGRHEVDHLTDKFGMVGWNFYMPVDAAAKGLLLMSGMGSNKDVEQEYQNLSKYEMYTQANR